VVALASLHIRTMNEIYGVGYPVIHDLHRLCFHRVVLSACILPNPITLCRYHGAQAFLKTPNQIQVHPSADAGWDKETSRHALEGS